MLVQNGCNPIRRKAVGSNSEKQDQAITFVQEITADTVQRLDIAVIKIDADPVGSVDSCDTVCSAPPDNSIDKRVLFNVSEVAMETSAVNTSEVLKTSIVTSTVTNFQEPNTENVPDDATSLTSTGLKDLFKSTTDAAFWKHAYAETKYFASGLFSQTTESNQHYTILRHSPPIIPYRGASTSVTISIFSSPSHTLPADRTLWLQRRGLSGDTGLKIRAMIGADEEWVNVTPLHQADVDKLDAADERAWQRDLGRVTEKEAKKGRKGHVIRETHAVRIPAALEDGYFRLALCTGGRGMPTEEEDHITEVVGEDYEHGPVDVEPEKLNNKNKKTQSETRDGLTCVVKQEEQNPNIVHDGLKNKPVDKRRSVFQKLKERTDTFPARTHRPDVIQDAPNAEIAFKSTFKKFKGKKEYKDADERGEEVGCKNTASRQDDYKQKPESAPAEDSSAKNTTPLIKTNKSLLQRMRGKNEEKKERRRRVLCSSPIFRLGSASADPSVFRGASLTTMPLELSIKVASIVGNAHVQTLIAPITSIASQLNPDFVELTVAQTAYDMSGLEDEVDARTKAVLGADAAEREKSPANATFLGPDSGAEAPFPIKFTGTVAKSTGRATKEIDTPTANLSGVPDHVKVQLKGLYFGWARVKSLGEDGIDETSHGVHLDWHAALISVGPDPYGHPSIAAEQVVRVHILHNFGKAQPFFHVQVKVITMGFLRVLSSPFEDLKRTKQLLAQDVEKAMANLSRHAWSPETVLESLAAAKRARSFKEEYINARALFKHKTTSIPVDRLGIRTGNAELLDKLYGTGGFWIARQ